MVTKSLERFLLAPFVERGMLEKFLKEIVALVAGSGSEKIVDVLFKKKNLNEFLIAKKLNLTINQARNILYKLGENGLVYFTRKKDSKSGGWYTYFWTLDESKSLANYRDRLLKEIESLENDLETKKTQRFYVCKICGMEVNEENALLYNFTCPECGEVFQLKDSNINIQELDKKITGYQEKVLLVDKELDELKEKEDEGKAKAHKKAALEKASERAKKRAVQKKLRAKEAGKKGKKRPAKKSKKHTKKAVRNRPKKKSKKHTKKIAKKETSKAKKKLNAKSSKKGKRK